MNKINLQFDRKVHAFHNDPGHGWYSHSAQEVFDAGVIDQITTFSYMDSDGNVFLEEDMDAHIFYTAVFGDLKGNADHAEWVKALPDRYKEHSPVRNLPNYNAKFAQMIVDTRPREERVYVLKTTSKMQVNVTADVSSMANNTAYFDPWMLCCLNRHLTGDFGDIVASDAKLNRESVENGNRIVSSYNIPEPIKPGKVAEKIFIITDAGHLVTTILFPHEY